MGSKPFGKDWRDVLVFFDVGGEGCGTEDCDF